MLDESCSAACSFVKHFTTFKAQDSKLLSA